MKLPRRKPLLPHACLLLGIFAHGPIAGQTVPEATGVSGLRLFLESMYPELPTERVDLAITSNEPFDTKWTKLRSGQFEIWQQPFAWPSYMIVAGDERRAPKDFERRPLMRGEFALDASGRLEEFTARDSFLANSGKNFDLHALVESHRDWNEAQGLRALREAAPRYGPGEQEAFMKAIPLKALERFFGSLTIQSIKFDTMIPASANTTTPAVAFFQWHVAIRGQRSGESPVNYVLHFEPFEAKLVQIMKAEK